MPIHQRSILHELYSVHDLVVALQCSGENGSVFSAWLHQGSSTFTLDRAMPHIARSYLKASPLCSSSTKSIQIFTTTRTEYYYAVSYQAHRLLPNGIGRFGHSHASARIYTPACAIAALADSGSRIQPQWKYPMNLWDSPILFASKSTAALV